MTHSYRVSTASRRGWKSLAWCLATGLSLMTGAEALAQEQEDPGVDPRLYSEKVLEEGEGYQLKLITGTPVDDGRAAEPYSREFYTLTSLSALETLRMPLAIQEDVRVAFTEAKEMEDTVFSIDKRIVDELRIAEERGELTPYLKEIAEPADEGDTRGLGAFGSCSDKIYKRSKSFSINAPINTSANFGGGFSGSFYTTGNMSGSAAGEVVVKLKRSKAFWVCIPYAVRFGHARAWGNASVSNDSSINGALNYTFNWQRQISKPHLGSLNFMAGPLPVHIGFNLPIEVGVSISATATGTIAYNGQQTATGSFDYTCTSSNCSGYANYSLGSAPTPQPVTGSVSGRIYPTLWAQVAVRAYLYSEGIAYAQVGLRPYLYGDLWGYYGNTCGDANGDSINETVSALTFDLDWRLFVTARASVLGSTNNWNLWSTSRRHIKFWDLLSGGSSAIRPTLLGPSSTTVNVLTSYSSRMRPCWPYSDTVYSRFSWGDSTYTSYSAAPSTTTTRSKAWTTTGSKGVQSTALSDSHGRGFTNATITRKVAVY